MRQMKRGGLFLLLFLWGSSFVYRQFQGGFVSNFLFYAISVLSFLEVWIYLGTHGQVKVDRQFNKKELKEGEELFVTLRVAVQGFFPFLLVTVIDPLSPKLGGATQGNRIWKLLIGRRSFQFSYRLRSIPRGEHPFTEVWVEFYDLFGFFTRQLLIPLADQILVYPSYEEIRSFPTVNEKNTGLTFALGRTSENVASVMGIRDYMPGDRINRIHWRATARTGSLKTKEFEVHVTNDFLLFLDSTRAGYMNRTSEFERAVRLAATLIHFSVRNHFRVGLSLHQRSRFFIPLGRDPFHEVRLFKELARVQPISDYSFTRQLLDSIPYIPYGVTLIIITPEWSPEMIRLLTLLRMRKMAIEFFHVGSQIPEKALSFFLQEGIRFHLLDNRPLGEILKGGTHIEKRAVPD